tara:strand:+ start:184 stop:978 length:795 start_codon:yes stop_codon:yes gene_type:complete
MAYREEIKENWDEHKCNPMIMPFASWFGKDAVETFTICIAMTQRTLLKHFLGPIEHTLSLAGNLGGNMIKDMNNMRGLLKNSTLNISSITNNLFGEMFNMRSATMGLLGQAKLIISKVIGTFVVLIYIMKTMVSTGQSTVYGPIGQYFCFKQDTLIKLKNKQLIKMKDIKLGSKLNNDIEVVGILRLKNHNNEPFYKIYSEDLNNYIYVTGGHLIYNDETKKFIKVKYHSKSIKTDIIDSELSCLITSNNKIPIGEYTFWDWED